MTDKAEERDAGEEEVPSGLPGDALYPPTPENPIAPGSAAEKAIEAVGEEVEEEDAETEDV